MAVWLACGLAEGSLGGSLGGLLPLVVLVRAGGDPLSVEGLAASSRIPPRQVESSLKRGRALVIVDGLDEAREPERFFAQLMDFAERWPKTRLVATARPAAVEGVPFPAFHTVRVAPLTTDEIADFVLRWCRSAEYAIQANRDEAERTAMAAAADLNARIRASRPVQQLATNPLVCGVVCVVHRFLGQRIPERRAALYEVCANVLLYDWDRARFPPDAAIGRPRWRQAAAHAVEPSLRRRHVRPFSLAFEGDAPAVRAIAQGELGEALPFSERERRKRLGHRRLARTVLSDDHGHGGVEREVEAREATDVFEHELERDAL